MNRRTAFSTSEAFTLRKRWTALEFSSNNNDLAVVHDLVPGMIKSKESFAVSG